MGLYAFHAHRLLEYPLAAAGKICVCDDAVIAPGVEPSPSAKTRAVTARVSEELAQKLDLIAERLGRSSDWIVEQALFAWIDR